MIDSILNYKTKHKEGFTVNEMETLLRDMKIDKELFFNKSGVNTGIIVDGDFLTYHCDVELAVRCCIEGREPNMFEWD